MGRNRGRRGRRNRHKKMFNTPDGMFVVPSMETLAAGSGLPVEEVREAIEELRSLGWVAVPAVPDDDDAPIRGHLTIPTGAGR